jgi:hypothetical protein
MRFEVGAVIRAVVLGAELLLHLGTEDLVVIAVSPDDLNQVVVLFGRPATLAVHDLDPFSRQKMRFIRVHTADMRQRRSDPV